MKVELTVKELGKVLKYIGEKYELDILLKSNLSGGWMTMTGKAEILSIPDGVKKGCTGKSDNIIDIKIIGDNGEGAVFKITGNKAKKFIIDISSTRYRELSKNSLTINQIKINDSECKLRIDEDMIFTIKDTEENISKIIESQIIRE